MKKAKKLLSLLLAVMMLFSCMSVGIGGIAVFAAAGGSVTVAGTSSVTYNRVDDVIICVPETIYMSPTTGASVSGQYFVNNIVDSSGNVTLATDRADTTGQISIYAPGATKFSFNVTAAVGGIGEPVIGASSTDASASLEGTWNFTDLGGSTGYCTYDGLQLFINGTGVSMGSMASIKWEITLTFTDGSTATYYVYSTLYTPHLSVGAVSESRRSGTYNNEISSWISGINGLPGGWSPISTGNGDKTTAGYFMYDPLIYGLQGGSSESSDDYIKASTTWLYAEGKAPSGSDWTRAVGYLGSLTIDASRYSNINQIPNLTIGSDALRVNDSKKDSLGKYYAWWIIGDNTKTIGTDKDSTPSGWTQFVNLSEPQATSRNTVVPSYAVSSINGLYIHTASQGYCTYLSSKNYANACASVLCTTVNKAELRNLVLQASSVNKANYAPNGCFDYYEIDYQNAAYVLGNPSASQAAVDEAVTRLNYSINGCTAGQHPADSTWACPGLQIYVNYNANGGSVSSTGALHTIGTATTVSVTPSTATRTGYTFKGWSTSSSATSGSTAKPLSVSLYSRNLYATWSANNYNLVFDNLFDFKQNKDYIANTYVSVDELTDTGFTITALQKDGADHNDCTTQFGYKIAVKPNTTYVFYSDVSHVAAGSHGYEIFANVMDSSYAHLSDNTVVSDCKLEGGYVKGSNTNTFTFTTSPSAAYVNFRFDVNDTGSVMTVNNIRFYEAGKVDPSISYHASKEVTYDATYGTLPTPTRPGYVFAGWYDEDGAGYWANDKVAITSDKNLYSKWTPNNYTVTFEKNIGDGTSTQTNYTPDDSVTVPTLTRIGYTLTGWLVTTADGNWSGTYNAGDVLTGMYGSAILQAQWAIANYTITYDANGGSCSETTKSYTISDTVTLPTPTKTGYTFAGWKVASTDGNWSGTNLTGNVSSKYGAVTLTAQWQAIPYAITFYDWDDKVLQQSDVDYDSMPTPPEDPTRAADNGYTYEFAGWNPIVATVTGAATYTATYNATPIPYTITLDAGEGSVSTSSVAYNYESTSVTLPTPTRTGYTFTGWTVKSSAGSWTAGDAVDGALANAYGDVTLVANYTPNEYTVTYDANGGAIEDGYSASFVVTYNGTVGVLLSGDEVKRTGYTFAGWNTAADGTGADVVAGQTWKYTSDTTIYAQWDATKYTITFITRDVTYNKEDTTIAVPSSITYTIEDDLSEILPDTTVEGYDFNYWLPKNTIGSWNNKIQYETAELTTGNYGNVTLYMYYTAKSYTITWVNYDGEVLETDTAFYGSTPSYDGATPTKAPTDQYQYDFAGWGDPVVDTETGNVTYTATYIETTRKYTIKFVDYDGDVIDTQSLEYGKSPEVPADPTREQDAQYTYTFSSWKDEAGNKFNTIPRVTADVTYTADYTATTRSYTITWIVDGKSSTTTVKYGETPAYGSTPKKDDDAQYTYSFLGWSTTENGTVADPVSVTGTATYYAVFGATTNKYDVVWKNADGTTLETDEDVEYGTTPSYDGETPTKAADAQYTYTFAGWDPEVNTVTGNVTYTATYTETVNKYTVTWVNEDGTLLETDENVPYGTTPSYDGETPTKDATAEWTYAFAGWKVNDNDEPNNGVLPEVKGDVTYKADYTANKNSYTITFVDEDGTTVLDEQTVEYGKTPELPATPTKKTTAQYSYEFDKWTPEVVAVTGAATYKATYTATVNTYTVTWYNYNGSVLETDENVEYGTAPSFDGVTPTKPTDGQNIYGFSGWGASVDGTVYNSLPTVSGDMNFYAIFVSSDAKFTITWVNYDGTVLETDEDVTYGDTPVYNGAENPTRAEDDQYIYTFDGWTPAVTPATANVTYTAKYSTETKKYTITFKNEDGTVLQSSEVAYGETPAYNGETPTKTGDAQYSYTFKEWSPAISSVTEDATYTATYDSTVNKYTIVFENEDGTVLQSSEVEYGTLPTYNGSTPTKAADAQYTYTFAGWNTTPVAVTGEATYTATYSNTTNKYTIKFVNEDGTELQLSEVAYGETPVYLGETPTKAATAQYTYTHSGWTPAIESVTGDAIYTATYDSTVNKYTIKFVNEDGTVLQSSEVKYGETPSYTGAVPTKAETAQYTYTHSGWTPAVVAVTGEATYTATYSATVNEYTITWVTGTDTYTGTWAYGSTPDPVTDKVDTSKASTDSTDYAFASWDVEIAEVTGAATYTAQYTETTRKYTITWIVDGVSTLEDVEYGTVPTAPADPTKASTDKYEYSFTGWDNEVVEVTGVATYIAEFAESIRKYTITWVVGDTKTTTTVAYGDTPVFDGTPTLAPTAEREYTFTTWSPVVTDVTGEKTYTAQFSEKLRSYTITYVIDGTVVDTQILEFGSNFSHPEIPAREGYSSYWKVDYMTMPAQDITINAVYTEKKYTVTWVVNGETVYEEKIPFGSSIPEKIVPEKVGHDGEWDNVPSTMPADDITITAVYTPATYTVVWTFATASGTDTATYGETWSVVFINYVPGDVRITINGVLLSADLYSYNSDSGYLQINADAITGNVTITERAAEGYQNVTISAVNATVTNATSIVKEGTAFHTQIVPNEGHLLPTSVVVCIDGIELHSGYSYDLTTGRLTINGDVIYGELSIRFESPVDPEYGTTNNNNNNRCTCSCHSSNAFIRFFYSIATFFRKLFGMEQYHYCGCGVAHW